MNIPERMSTEKEFKAKKPDYKAGTAKQRKKINDLVEQRKSGKKFKKLYFFFAIVFSINCVHSSVHCSFGWREKHLYFFYQLYSCLKKFSNYIASCSIYMMYRYVYMYAHLYLRYLSVGGRKVVGVNISYQIYSSLKKFFEVFLSAFT